MRTLKLSLGFMALFLFASFSPVITGTVGTGPDIPIPETKSPELEEAMEKVRDNAAFIENKGQMGSDEIEFYSSNGNVFFTSTGVMYRFREMEPIEDVNSELDPILSHRDEAPRSYHERGVVLKYTFIGANTVIPVGRERCSWNTNYFKGNDPEKWYAEVPSFGEVIYPEIWDGIDIVYRQNEEGIKYDIIVHPGADPENIRIRIDGATHLSINQNRDLVIGTEYLDIIDGGLYSYYLDGFNDKIPSKFKLISDYEYTFNLGEYDITKTLVIDPLIYSTFIGGSGVDLGYAIASDSNGNVYITGETYDSATKYPTTPGAYDATHNDNSDVFVTKLSSDGSSLIYSTYIGGSSSDSGYGIAIDSTGCAYISGSTGNSDIDFPTTAGAYDTEYDGGNDAFVTKLSSDGSSLVYSTLLGGSGVDRGYGITIDLSGDAYITGYTQDSTTDFPTTIGAYDPSHNGDDDAFVTKLSSDGSSLIYSTFLGGPYGDISYAIAVNSSGCAYITGVTYFMYPTTTGAYDTSSNGGADVFVTKLGYDGSSLTYSTFIGGSTSDEAYGISIDPSGNAYITGYTGSSDYPTTLGAYDTTYNEGEDVIVTKLSSTGSSLIYSTYIGGSHYDLGFGITVDPNGNAYITGRTHDGATDYPTTRGAYDTIQNGISDVFLTQLNSSGSFLMNSTFLGGSGYDHGRSIALDSSGNVYLTGYTDNSETDYPTTNGAYDKTQNGDYDVYISKIKFTTIPTKPLNLNGSIWNGYVKLTWEPPLSDGGYNIINYTIFKGQTSTVFFKLISLGNVTTYNDTAIINDQTYYYYIVANNSIDESYPSDILKVWDNKPPVILE
ncbi:MAG: SBBP repeat-containing protein, partial [Candidatus Thermoplasmatota archaeon]|nr:SBBP repeat-containing protein [Candidatus Thermoplasmatota archaeon]